MTDSERITQLEKQMVLVVQKLDAVLRKSGMSPILDEQSLLINSRTSERKVA